MNKLKIFENQEFGRIRAIEKDGEPWFVGKDVAEALGYSDSKSAISDHVDTEDKQILQKGQNTTLDIPNRGLTVINESGLYSLILSSKLPTAKKFKRWVTSEVLPAIRRTGTYFGKCSQQSDESKRKNAEARLMNARTRMSDQFLKLMNVIPFRENTKTSSSRKLLKCWQVNLSFRYQNHTRKLILQRRSGNCSASLRIKSEGSQICTG